MFRKIKSKNKGMILMEFRIWHTLLELKEDYHKLGFKGDIFFINDLPMNIETGEINFVLYQPTFTGIGVGTGAFCFVVTREQVKGLFNVLDKTFEEYAKELKNDYFEKGNING